jgi:hypothetical protein
MTLPGHNRCARSPIPRTEGRGGIPAAINAKDDSIAVYGDDDTERLKAIDKGKDRPEYV